ncbi:polyprenyl synthetase family protein [Agromyces laixinhei]|uniref:polyprenyl synthetase family protein n=1 Tax=Agromyces laixinhei TaxID=2585717 RepID=UPI0012EDB7D7|nr:polyprenyl synthetase family protein [Agromyces laixinhei]
MIGAALDSELDSALESAIDPAPAPVDELLDEFFEGRIAQAAAVGDDYRRLWSAARDASGGGKRIRPALVLAAHDAFACTGSTAAAAVSLAAAFELLHTAFLMHDDVIDHDQVRRGVPNVAGRFAHHEIARGASSRQANQYGEASAILAGDLLISAAYRFVAELDVTTVARRTLLSIVDDGVFLAAAGEQADVRQATGGMPSERDILTMIEQKTASYSFSAPLQAGAHLGGAPADAVGRLGEIGRHMGIAFQLRDDVLGVFGTEAETGKSVLSDLREGKQTLLIAYSRGLGAWEEASASFGRPDLDESDAARLRAAIEAVGSRERVERLIATHRDAALQAIESPLIPVPLRDELTAMVRNCTERAR